MVTVKTSMSFSGIKFAPSGVDWLLEIYPVKFMRSMRGVAYFTGTNQLNK